MMKVDSRKDSTGLINIETFLPETINKVDLFNKISEARALKELADGKKFSVLGVISEVISLPVQVEQPAEEDGAMPYANQMTAVDRQRLIIITDRGVYVSYSVTFAAAIKRAIDVFGHEAYKQGYKLNIKLSGTGATQKAFYVLTIC